MQAFPMMDGEMRDNIRFGHPQIDGGADAAFRIGREGAVWRRQVSHRTTSAPRRNDRPLPSSCFSFLGL